ncbi:MAG: hypothetical protein ACR2MG_17530 [Pyrinomonadaceae bacterium]
MNNKFALIDNNKIKWSIHENYFALVLLAFLLAFLSLIILSGSDWKILLTIVGTLLSFVYFIQKQQLDEAKFSNELFIRFNQRFDSLNEKLNDILENKKGLKELESHEIDTLYDYFNLCGEEYLFYCKGYIYPEVWNSWVAGMEIFYNKPRIKELWLKELGTHSYYNLNVDEEIKQLPKQEITLKDKV